MAHPADRITPWRVVKELLGLGAVIATIALYGALAYTAMDLLRTHPLF